MTTLTTTVSGNFISIDDDFPSVEKVSLELDSTNPVSVSVTAGNVNAFALEADLNIPEAKAVLTGLFSLSGAGTGVSQLSGTDIWELTQANTLTWLFNSNVPYFEALLTGESLNLIYHLIAHDSLGNEISQDIPVPIVGETKIINVATHNAVIADLFAAIPVEGMNATLTVTTEANTTLKIFDGLTDVTTEFSTNIIDEQLGIWTVVFTPISDAYYGKSLTVKSTSADGSTIYDSRTNLVLNVAADITPPATPILSESGTNLSDNLLNNTETTNTTFRVTFPTTGSRAVVGDSVILLRGGVLIKTATLSSSHIGAGYIDIPVLKTDLGNDGSKSLTAKITDIAGNASSVSAAITFILDTTAPSPITLAETGSTKLSDSVINAAEATSNTTFRAMLPANLVAGDNVELLLDNSPFATPKKVVLTSTEIGLGYVNFAVTKTDLGNDGAKSLTALIQDIAGNGTTSLPISFTLKTIASAAPTLSLYQDTGTNSADFITNNGKVVVSGVEQIAGTTWQYSLDNGTSWSLKQNYTVSDFTLTGEGVKNVQVRQIDAVGNVSAARSFSFTLDTIAPTVPILTEQGTSRLADGRLNAAENISTVFRATLPAAVLGDKVELRLNDNAVETLSTQTLSIGGASYVDFIVPAFSTQGTNILTAFTIDVAGNRSIASQPLLFVLDTISPTAPTIAETGTHLADGKMNADEAVSTNFRVSLPTAGSFAASGDSVSLQLDSVTKTITLGSGNITAGFVDFTLTKQDLGVDGNKVIIAKITDAAGNVSVSNPELSFILTTTPPTAPALALGVDTGKAGDFITSVGRVSISDLAIGAKWQYSIDNGSHWLDGIGSEFTVKGDGSKTVLARQIDTAGNFSTQSSLNFVLDTSAPITLAAQGIALNDNLLNLSEATAGISFRVNLIGDVVLGDTVSLLLGGTSFSSQPINNLNIFNGYVDFSVSKAQLGFDGTKSITAQLLNAGTTTSTAPIAFTLDTKIPNAPSVTEHSSSTDLIDGKLNSAESVTTLFRISLSGTTEAVAGDSVELFLNNSSFAIPKTLTLGSVNITNGFVDFTVLKADLGEDGSKSLTARVTDIAGNISNASTPLAFALDTITPNSSITTTAFDFWNSIFSSKTIQINVDATAIAGDRVELLLNGLSFNKSVVLTSENITNHFVTINVARTDLGSDGIKSLTSVISDVSGNKSSPSAALIFTLDTNATQAPTLNEFGSTDLADGFVNDVEAVTNTVFRATLPTLGSRAVAGDTIQLLGVTPEKSVELSASDITNGYVDFTVLKTDLDSDGSKSLTTKITDKSGNVSATSSPIIFTFDTTAPIIPTFATIATLSDGQLNSAEAVNSEFRVNLTTTGVGAVVANDKVELLLNAGSFGIPKIAKLTASDISNGYVNFIVKQADLGADGTKSLTAMITDLAGNKSASSATTFTLKATLPTTPQLGFTDTGSPTDSITNNPQVTVSRLDTGASWEYSFDKGLSWHAGSGSSFSVSGDGVKSLLVRQTDVAGNISNAGNLSFTYDGTAPNTPILVESTKYLTDSFINKVEAVSTTFRVNLDNSHLVGDKVELLGGNAFNTAKFITISDADKTKGFVDFTVLKNDFNGEGSKSITAKITDIAGNSSTSSAMTFTLDTVATNAPTVTEVSSNKLSDGKLNYDETTSNTSFRVALPTSGVSALTGDKVELLLNGMSFSVPKFATLNSGNLTNGYVDFGLSKADLGVDGDKVLTAVITDRAGNVSLASAPLSFKLKATLPPTPAVSEFGTSYLSDSVLNNAEATSSVFQVSFPKNTLTVGDEIELLLGGNSFGTTKMVTLDATAISNGYVNFTVVKTDLGLDGNKALTAKITDTFSNVSAASKAVEFALNTSTDTTNFRVELPTSLAISGNTVEVLKNGASFSPQKIVTLANGSQSVDFVILNADVPANSKLTSVITESGTAKRYYLDSSFSVASTGIKTTVTTIIARSATEVLQGTTVTTVSDDKGYLKTTTQEYNASNTLLKTTVKEGIKTTVTEGTNTTISIDTTGLIGDDVANNQTTYKVVERDGSTTTYYLDTTSHALVKYTISSSTNTATISTTKISFYNEKGVLQSSTQTTITTDAESHQTTLISEYNSSNVLTGSTLIDGVKTTTKNASGSVTNINIDTTTLTGIPDAYNTNLVNYTVGNTTYSLDTQNNLVRYSAVASITVLGDVTTKISQIYNNVGLKIGDGKLSTQTAHSNYTETTTVQNSDSTKTVTNTVINDGYQISSVALYNASGILLSSKQIDGIKTTFFNAEGVVTSITIDATGLTGSTVEGYNAYNVGDNAGNVNTYYLNATSNELEKYSKTQTNENADNTMKTTTFFDKVGIFTGKSVSVASTQNGVMTASTKNYNASGVLVSSSQTESIKTTNYDASGNVLSITIDTTGLTATTTDEGVAYTDAATNATYYLNPSTNALIKYSISIPSGATVTNTFLYDAKGALTGSLLTEVTTQLSAVTRYDQNGAFIDKTEVNGRKTTIYDSEGNVQLITVNVTGLTGTPDATDSTKTHYTVIKGDDTIMYTLDANQAVVKYVISQTNTVVDVNEISHSLLTIATYNEKDVLVGNGSIDRFTLNGIEYVKSWTSTITKTSTGKSITDFYDNDGVQTSTTKNYDLNGNLLSSSRTEGVKTTFYKTDGSVDKVQIDVSGLNEITLGSKYGATDSNGVETVYTVTTGNVLVSYEINHYSDKFIDGFVHHVTSTQTFNSIGQLTGSKVTDESMVNGHHFTTIKQYNADSTFVNETKIEDRMTTVFDADKHIISIAFDATGLTPESTTNGINVYKQESDNGTYRYYLNGTNLNKYSLTTSDSTVELNVTHQTTITNEFDNKGFLTSTVNNSVDSFTTDGVLRTIRSESIKTNNANGSVNEIVRYFNDNNLISTTVTNYSATGDLLNKTQTVGHKITAFDSNGEVTRVSILVDATLTKIADGIYSETINGITPTYHLGALQNDGSYLLDKYDLTQKIDDLHYSTTIYTARDVVIGRFSVDGTKRLETVITYTASGHTETNRTDIDGHILLSEFTYDVAGLVTGHTETEGRKVSVYDAGGVLTGITIDKTGLTSIDSTTYQETIGNVTTTYYLQNATSNQLVKILIEQTTTVGGRTIFDTNTFNNLGILTAKTHTETEGANRLSNEIAFNTEGTEKTITDTTISAGKTFISTVIRKVSDDSILSSSQSDGIKTTTYTHAADGTVSISTLIDVSTKADGTYPLTDDSGVKTEYYVTNHALTKYIVTQKPYIYTDATGKQQTVTALKTFDANNVETGSSILNTVKIGDTEKAWSSFESSTAASVTTTTFLWIDDTKKGFSINQYDGSNNNLGSVFAKSVYSGSVTDLKSVSIDVTKNLMSNLAASDAGGKVTYTVSHALKDPNTTDIQNAYGSSLTASSITANDAVFYQTANTTATRYGVFGLDTAKPIHFIDTTTTTDSAVTEHKIDNWYLSKLAATETTNASGDNKLIEMATGNYTISGFKLGDVLHFSSTPTQTTLSNPSTNDGKIEIDVTLGTGTTHITLTGISNDIDASVGNTDMTNFNTIFGFGTSPII